MAPPPTVCQMRASESERASERERESDVLSGKEKFLVAAYRHTLLFRQELSDIACTSHLPLHLHKLWIAFCHY